MRQKNESRGNGKKDIGNVNSDSDNLKNKNKKK